MKCALDDPAVREIFLDWKTPDRVVCLAYVSLMTSMAGFLVMLDNQARPVMSAVLVPIKPENQSLIQ